MRSRFDRELEKLHQELTKVGELCEEAISASVLALLEDDQAVASAPRRRTSRRSPGTSAARRCRDRSTLRR